MKSRMTAIDTDSTANSAILSSSMLQLHCVTVISKFHFYNPAKRSDCKIYRHIRVGLKSTPFLLSGKDVKPGTMRVH